MSKSPSDAELEIYTTLSPVQAWTKFMEKCRTLQYKVDVMNILAKKNMIDNMNKIHGCWVPNETNEVNWIQMAAKAGMIDVIERVRYIRRNGDSLSVMYILESENEDIQHWLRDRILDKQSGKLPEESFPNTTA